ncbi:hypothetical protein V1511DRAFT_486023 [Dipodascopsis uninucleata]
MSDCCAKEQEFELSDLESIKTTSSELSACTTVVDKAVAQNTDLEVAVKRENKRLICGIALRKFIIALVILICALLTALFIIVGVVFGKSSTSSSGSDSTSSQDSVGFERNGHTL